jgi:hypothetical protein
MSRKYMANLKLRRWLIKGPFKSERGGCREEKRIVVGCCCCGDDVKQMFVGRMKRKDHFIRRTTRVLCQKRQHQALSPAQHSQRSFFCSKHPWDCVVRLPQQLSAGVAAQTLLTYVFLSDLLHPACSALSVALGESHHWILGFFRAADPWRQSNTPPKRFVSLSLLCLACNSIILYHTALPANSQFHFVNSAQQCPDKGNAANCKFLSEVLMLFLERKSWQGCAAKPTSSFSLSKQDGLSTEL